MNRTIAIAVLFAFGFVSCDSYAPTSTFDQPDQEASSNDNSLGKKGGGENFAHIVALVDGVNDRLASKGSEVRLNYPWLFRIGQGVDPFGSLRIGARWMWMDPTYLLDESDYTADESPGDVEAALVRSFESWNDIPQTTVNAVRIPDGGGNYDILDLPTYDAGVCVDIVDTTSANLLFYDPATGAFDLDPEADIILGGWIDPAYFSDCLGSADILGVTWSFTTGADLNGDNYGDLVYVEQYYNSDFDWTNTDAAYLDFDAPNDIETIVVHENGHALGLGHFGGPIGNQPFVLKPNGRVFNPEAVMNPFYLGGEDRTPHKTDAAGLKTLYGRKGN